MIHGRPLTDEDFMLIRRTVVTLVVIVFLVLITLPSQKSAKAAPQAAARTESAHATKLAGHSDALSIPDKTLAINSSTPMSQRVVHYEIDAKYDATKHTIDATEVLT